MKQRPQYDSIGAAYDLVAGADLYHRFFWGVSAREYRAFARDASAGCVNGLLLDAGCGSMLFTVHVHRTHRGSVIGTDASFSMLRRARARLGSAGDRRGVLLLQADVLRSPFRSDIFDVVICMHVAHVLDDISGLLGEARRTLKPGGKLFLTSVVLVDNWRDSYLRMLYRRGIMARPRRREDILAAVRTRFGTEPAANVKGSVLFVQTTKQ